MTQTVALLGAGSWGTAIAVHLAKLGHRIFLWAHKPEHVALMVKEKQNSLYLPQVHFPAPIIPCSDLNECVRQADITIIAVPSHAFSQVLYQMSSPVSGLTWLTKGIDPDSNKLLHELVAARFSEAFPVAVVSGPSFATEVAQSLPTALTVASNNYDYQRTIHQLIHHQNIRAYLSNDLIGVQLCGAVKNVLAIACGISDGLGYGANAKAALITRGLAEMCRLGLSLGAQQETFTGLAGVGDLVLTCTDNQSRNRRFGLLLGQGITIADAEAQIGQVVEGKHNAAQINALAKDHQIEMPICASILDLLHYKMNPKEVAVQLMNRPAKDE